MIAGIRQSHESPAPGPNLMQVGRTESSPYVGAGAGRSYNRVPFVRSLDPFVLLLSPFVIDAASGVC